MPAGARGKPVSPILQPGDPLASGLVLGLPLAQPGSLVLPDASGQGNPGTLVNGPGWASGLGAEL